MRTKYAAVVHERDEEPMTRVVGVHLYNTYDEAVRTGLLINRTGRECLTILQINQATQYIPVGKFSVKR